MRVLFKFEVQIVYSNGFVFLNEDLTLIVKYTWHLLKVSRMTILKQMATEETEQRQKETLEDKEEAKRPIEM